MRQRTRQSEQPGRQVGSPQLARLAACRTSPGSLADGEIVAWRPSGSFALAVAACCELGLSADETLDSVAWRRERGAYNDDEIILNLA